MYFFASSTASLIATLAGTLSRYLISYTASSRIASDGFEILVGRNNAQNDKLTLHTARGKDLWFHVQKAPGSHVVVMSRGEDIPDTTRQEAAELAVIYSSAYKAGTGAKVAVDTTEVKNIWKANGAKPGMVLYEVYTTVYITPRDGLEEQLKQKK